VCAQQQKLPKMSAPTPAAACVEVPSRALAERQTLLPKGQKRIHDAARTTSLEKEKASSKRRASVASPLRKRIANEARPPISKLQTIVISLQRRPDRMTGCAERLKKHCPELPFRAFAATDGRERTIPEEEVTLSWNTARNVIYQKQRAIRKGWDDLETYQVRTLKHSPGERGCSSSHICAWRLCLEQAGDSDRPLLVLEDDAAPTPEFRERLQRAMSSLPSDADVLYLGYSQAADWRREVSEELVESVYVWTTVAYIIWPSGARKLLSRLPINEPVDNWMAGFAAEQELNSYCVRPKVVLQADAWNVNSDVGHSDEHYWGPNSDIQHSDALYWGPDHPEAKAALNDSALAAAGGSMAGSSIWDINSDEESEDSLDL